MYTVCNLKTLQLTNWSCLEKKFPQKSLRDFFIQSSNINCGIYQIKMKTNETKNCLSDESDRECPEYMITLLLI